MVLITIQLFSKGEAFREQPLVQVTAQLPCNLFETKHRYNSQNLCEHRLLVRITQQCRRINHAKGTLKRILDMLGGIDRAVRYSRPCWSFELGG